MHGTIESMDLNDEGYFGLIVQNPDNSGAIHDYSVLFAAAQEQGIKTVVAADIMALVMMTSPGEMGADAVVGSTQRFGIPMGYGGPHAAYFATKEEFKRQIPGRIIGASLDISGNNAYRMALQTREQHIRREKATSNICTAQVLLAVMAGMYAVYHGPSGLRKIAGRIHGLTRTLERALVGLGCSQLNENYFDTLKIQLPEGIAVRDIEDLAIQNGVNFRYFDNGNIGISLDETTRFQQVSEISSFLSNNASLSKLISLILV